jgi:putative PIN family toxin of toxin-antitoxin system
MRVVIDTNVFVSGLMLPTSVPGRILTAAITGGFEIVLCDVMLEEVAAALHYPKVRRRIALSNEELDRYVQALRFMADVVDPSGAGVSVPGDPDDDVVLGTLVVGKADWLVTGDTALLTLADKFPICTPAEFASRHLP